MVDPGYRGPLSSILINFGRADFLVSKGPPFQPFLRVSFHPCPPSPKASKSKKWERAEYLKEARKDALAYSDPTFLNVKETSAKAAEQVFGSFTRSLAWWVTIAAVLFALITILVPLGASYVQTLVDKRDKRAEAIEGKLENQNDQLKTLSDQIRELQRSLAVKTTKASPVSGRQ